MKRQFLKISAISTLMMSFFPIFCQEIKIDRLLPKIPQETKIDKSIGNEPYNILTGAMMVPVGFSKIENVDGNYQIGKLLNLGLGYTLILGKIDYEMESITKVKPLLFIGASVDAAVRENEGILKWGCMINGYIGTGLIGLSYGYDIFNKTEAYGIALKIDAFDFMDDFYSIFALWKNPKPKIK